VSVTVSEMGVVLHQSRSVSQWTALPGIRDTLLSQQILDGVKGFDDDSVVFQQDSAPVHLACNTVQLLQWKTQSCLYASNSPQRIAIDYKI